MNMEFNIDHQLLAKLVLNYNLLDDVNMFLIIKDTYRGSTYGLISEFLQKIPESIAENNDTHQFINDMLNEDISHIYLSNQNETDPRRDFTNFNQDLKFSQKLITSTFQKFSFEQEEGLDHLIQLQIFTETFSKFKEYVIAHPNSIYLSTLSNINIATREFTTLDHLIKTVLPMYDKAMKEQMNGINQLNKIDSGNRFKPSF